MEGHNSLDTYQNGASKESIGIYAKNRCQWSSCLIKKAQTKEIWPFEYARALGTAAVAKAPKGLDGLAKQKCVLEVP